MSQKEEEDTRPDDRDYDERSERRNDDDRRRDDREYEAPRDRDRDYNDGGGYDDRNRGGDHGGARGGDRVGDRGSERYDDRNYGGVGGEGGGGAKSTGTAVSWSDRGFGFIKPDDEGPDLFCHASAITDGNALEANKKVTYIKIYDDRRGKDRADQVTGGVTRDTPPPGGGGFGGGGYGGGAMCHDFEKGRCTRG